MSLKEKAISGFFWGAINNLSVQVVQFIVGLILARILSPEDFGLVGMLIVFISISASFIDGGFTAALIRKKHCTELDYSTIFVFNLSIALLLYFILFAFSGVISDFFLKPELKKMLQVLSLKLVFDAFSIIQITKVSRELNFKFQAKISLVSAFVSGVLSILSALNGLGPWSLVVQAISFSAINTILFYTLGSWRPSLIFSKASFNEMVGFGSRLLGSSLLGKLSNELNAFLIGKYLSFADLGFYTRANTFKNLPSATINTILTKVSYPLLAKFSSDRELLRLNYKKIIKITTYISAAIMGIMAATADNFIIILIGEKWEPSILLFQMLSVVGMLYPLQALNLNILNVIGRSDVHLKITLVKNLISIPILVISIFYGLKMVVVGMIITAAIHFVINSTVSGRFINYGLFSQIKDIAFQSTVITLICILVYAINFLNFGNYAAFCLQVVVFVVLLFTAGELLNMYAYRELSNAAFALLKIKKK